MATDNPTAPKCLDCTGAMYEIMLIDRQGGSFEKGGMDYTAPEATQGMWSGKFPVQGRIVSLMCEECGSVRLFGQPVT